MAWFSHGKVRIHYEVAGSGTPLLLMPGFSGTITTYQPLIERFARHHRVIAADLPGSGQSLPQPRTYGTDYYQRDAEAFAALLHDIGTGPAHVLGHSDGGEVALVMAAQNGGSVRSVVAWGAAGLVSDPGGQIGAAFRKVVDAPSEGWEGYRTYLIDTYGAASARAMVQSFADGLDAIVAAGGDIMRDTAHRITCPVLLIAGRNDGICPPSVVGDLAALITGAGLIVAEEAGHGVHEDRPAWFLQTVADWLARH